MIHIKFDTKGKAVYAYQHKIERKPNNLELLTPVPIIPRMLCKRLKIDDWYIKYQRHIDEVICAYMNVLVDFLEINSHYTCNVNEFQLRKKLLCMLYYCSHNSFKNYPSL